MWNRSDNFVIAPIDNEYDARLCAQLLSEEFAANNSLCIFTRRPAQSLFDRWLQPAINHTLDEKLSFLIRDQSTNEIIATIFACDFFSHWNDDPYDPSAPACEAVDADFYHELSDRFVHHDFKQELKPNLVLYVAAVGTRTGYTGRNLAMKLSTHLCNYARDQRGFQYAFVQTTHPATRNIFVKKMNGEEKTIVDPATWIWKKKDDGLSYPFKDYVGEPAVNILVELKA